MEFHLRRPGYSRWRLRAVPSLSVDHLHTTVFFMDVVNIVLYNETITTWIPV